MTSFKSHVSGRSDEENRGNGLTDVLKIAMECNSILRVDSNGTGFSFNIGLGVDNFEIVDSIYKGNGTIISILFIDDTFGSINRDDVNNYIDTCLEKL